MNPNKSTYDGSVIFSSSAITSLEDRLKMRPNLVEVLTKKKKMRAPETLEP
jgi:hypothetical protein